MNAPGSRIWLALAACAGAALSAASSAPARAAFTEQGSTILDGSRRCGDGPQRVAGRHRQRRRPRPVLSGRYGRAAILSQQYDRHGVVRRLRTSRACDLRRAGLGPSWSAGWGDYDGDGRVDVFVGQTNGGGTTGDVLRNNGRGVLERKASATGLNDPGFHQNVAWTDIDNDRDLDLLIGMEGPGEARDLSARCRRQRSRRWGRRSDSRQPMGTKAYGMAIGDTDGDGDLDIYISTCQRRRQHPQQLLQEHAGRDRLAQLRRHRRHERHAVHGEQLRRGVSRLRRRRRSRPVHGRRRRQPEQDLAQRRRQHVHRRRYDHRAPAADATRAAISTAAGPSTTTTTAISTCSFTITCAATGQELRPASCTATTATGSSPT